jgi:predicted acylesterase/phospholipase RssA/CRP-like cAMP-binding protein
VTTDVSVLAGLRLTAGFPLPLRERIAERLVPQHLSGGAWLFRQGDPGSTLFLVRSGRMEIVRTTGETSRVVALMQAGDSLGALALLSGGTRSAGARAVRDCELLALHQRDVAPLLGDPDFAAAMLGSVTRMLRADPPDHDAASRRTVVAVLCEDAARCTEITGALAEAFSTEGVRCATLTAPSARLGHPPHVLPQRTGRRLDQLERTHDVVLLDAGTPDSEWGRVCARQADRVILLIGPTTPPLHDRDDLIGCQLVVMGDRDCPAAALDAWEDATSPRAHHRLRDGHRRSDLGRLARRLSGRSLGLVLSGGGARALAHVGVLEALEDAGVVVDRFGGTSMGAFLSGLAATGRSAADVREVVVRELMDNRPFRDWTVPRLALIRGEDAERMLQRVFGDTDVRQLPRSWFAVSASLDRAATVVHRRGPTWEAAACSMSLPGLAPPRRWNGQVVVDGGVLDNLPVLTMCGQDEGQVIASDVTMRRLRGDAGRPAGLPTIVETLTTTMALASHTAVDRGRRAARLVIDPVVDDLDLLDFGQVDRAIRAGRVAAERALEAAGDLRRPVGAEALLPAPERE